MVSQEFADQHMDVLQNLESVIMACYRDHPALADSNVERVMELLLRSYKAQSTGHIAPKLNLAGSELELFKQLKAMGDRYTGDSEASVPYSATKFEAGSKSVDEITGCLKYLRRSVNFWTKSGGRQGYLNYVSEFF
jgi:hypothetical protein